MKINLLLIGFIMFSLSNISFAQKNNNKKVVVEAPKIIDTLNTSAEYPGGLGELMRFIRDHREYANNKDEKTGIGNINVSFVIEKDGSIADSTINVNTPNAGYYGQEAIRLVKLLPKWIPAKLDGKAVRIKFTLPIRF